MSLDQLPFNWFDLVVVAMLFIGLQSGRKRGMSEELLYVIQWVGIVFGGAALYEAGGKMLSQSTPFTLLSSYIMVYLGIAIIIKVLISLFRRGLGGKMIGSDIFGGGEYYLGMFAGMLRFACMLMAALAILNAKYFNPEEVKAMESFQKDVYGSDFFPGLHNLQVQVFEKSAIGPFIKKDLDFFLIKPTASEKKGLKRAGEYEFPK